MSMKFLAYFDYLGFKDFIERNTLEQQEAAIHNNYRDIENALAKGKLKEGRRGYIAELDDVHVNATVFSDTVVFWTKDDSIESLKEILEVAYRYNWSCIDFFFPVRGCLVHGELIDHKFAYTSSNKASYTVNSVYGRSLVSAHLKAESQNWAGSVIDTSVLAVLDSQKIKHEELLSPYAKLYRVPYHEGVPERPEEWVFNLIARNQKINDEAYNNMKKNITDNFANFNKRIDSDTVKKKIKNTIDFLESYR